MDDEKYYLFFQLQANMGKLTTLVKDALEGKALNEEDLDDVADSVIISVKQMQSALKDYNSQLGQK